MRSLTPARLDRVDQPLGNAAQAEPAGADRHPVEQQPVERGARHRDRFSSSIAPLDRSRDRRAVRVRSSEPGASFTLLAGRLAGHAASSAGQRRKPMLLAVQFGLLLLAQAASHPDPGGARCADHALPAESGRHHGLRPAQRDRDLSAPPRPMGSIRPERSTASRASGTGCSTSVRSEPNPAPPSGRADGRDATSSTGATPTSNMPAGITAIGRARRSTWARSTLRPVRSR